MTYYVKHRRTAPGSSGFSRHPVLGTNFLVVSLDFPHFSAIEQEIIAIGKTPRTCIGASSAGTA